MSRAWENVWYTFRLLSFNVPLTMTETTHRPHIDNILTTLTTHSRWQHIHTDNTFTLTTHTQVTRIPYTIKPGRSYNLKAIPRRIAYSYKRYSKMDEFLLMDFSNRNINHVQDSFDFLRLSHYNFSLTTFCNEPSLGMYSKLRRFIPVRESDQFIKDTVFSYWTFFHIILGWSLFSDW